MHTTKLSPLRYARVAGLLYLLIIITGAIGQIFIRGSLIVPGDAAATANHIMASQSLWRIGIAGDLLMHIFDLPVMVILYTLLNPVNKPLALLGLLFNLIQTAVLVVNKLVLLLPLIVLGNAAYVEAFTPAQIDAQIYWFTEVHDYGFGLGLIFFGFACLIYGYLLFKSGYFPKLIGLFVAVAGLSYLISSVTLLLAPAYAATGLPILVLSLIGELAFSLWLIVKGVDVAKWESAIDAHMIASSHSPPA